MAYGNYDGSAAVERGTDTASVGPSTEWKSVFFRGQSLALVSHPGPNDEQLVHVVACPQSASLRLRLVVKRVCDFTAALFALIVGLPLLLVIAAGVKLTSRGPVLFRQKRLGLHGNPFFCYKFRTMVANAEQVLRSDPELHKRYHEEGFKIKDDPRLTKIGGFLRKTSLDETPQLLNVLRGDMSLIGPRPVVPAEIAKYRAYGPKLLSVKPGLGGLWQACGRSDIDYDERIEMDMAYIDNWSLMLDAKLVIRTAISVCRTRGAY
jgi:lipopolysaccharide/colanic/teichoic acid biosynthesis glycosyltransferase